MIPPHLAQPAPRPRMASVSACASRQWTSTGLPTRRGQLEQRAERPLLRVARREVAEEVEADLADRDHARLAGQPLDLAQRRPRPPPPRRADGCRPTPTRRPRARPARWRRARSRRRCRSSRRPAHAGRARALQHRRRGPRRTPGSAGARACRRARAAHGTTRKRSRPMSWPEAVTTSTVQRPDGVVGKRRLARERPEALAPPALHRREPHDVDDRAVAPPHVLDGLAQPGRRVDRRVGDEPALAQLGDATRSRATGSSDSTVPTAQPIAGPGQEQRRRRNHDAPEARDGSPGRRRPRMVAPRAGRSTTSRARGAPPASARPPPPRPRSAGRRTAARRPAAAPGSARRTSRRGRRRSRPRDADARARRYHGSNVASSASAASRTEEAARSARSAWWPPSRRAAGRAARRGRASGSCTRWRVSTRRCAPLLGGCQRAAHLHQHRHQQPEQEQVADDQADVREAAAKHEQRERARRRARQIEIPHRRSQAQNAAHPGGPSRSTIRRATVVARAAPARTRARRPRRRACGGGRRTSSSAPARTAPSSAQISRSTPAMEASRSATWTIAST